MGGYGLIGGALTHSFSPEIHKLLGDYEYRLYPLPKDALPAFMRENDLEGFNVTIPYKQAVIPYCEALSDAAKRIGSVNTVVRQADGSYYGDNTDYAGFLKLLGDARSIAGKKALILGSGGAAKTVRAALTDAGLSPVVTISRSGADNYQNLDRHADAALLVNATPVGMYPDVDASPVSLDIFPRLTRVIDLIYNPLKTRLLLDAEDRGIPAQNGLLMLAAQAEEAAVRFGRCAPGGKRAETVARILENRRRNVALIGMPGSGKTTVGALLARRTGRRFFDIDEIIEQIAGRSIPEIFRDMGEAGFRKLETRALAQAAKETGCVVATGGGVVTNPENRLLLRQNCRIVQIERPLADLPVTGRPLSAGAGVEALYRARKPLYDQWSDETYKNDDPEALARRIAAKLCN